jgi:hypothetical protein
MAPEQIQLVQETFAFRALDSVPRRTICVVRRVRLFGSVRLSLYARSWEWLTERHDTEIRYDHTDHWPTAPAAGWSAD